MDISHEPRFGNVPTHKRHYDDFGHEKEEVLGGYNFPDYPVEVGKTGENVKSSDAVAEVVYRSVKDNLAPGLYVSRKRLNSYWDENYFGFYIVVKKPNEDDAFRVQLLYDANTTPGVLEVDVEFWDHFLDEDPSHKSRFNNVKDAGKWIAEIVSTYH